MDVSELKRKRFLIAGKEFYIEKYDEENNRVHLISEKAPPLNCSVSELMEYINKGIIKIIDTGVEGYSAPAFKLNESEFNLLMRRAKQREKRIKDLLEKVDYTLDKINECSEKGWVRQKKRYEERLRNLHRELVELEYFPYKEV